MNPKPAKLDAAQKKAVKTLADLRMHRKATAPSQFLFWQQYEVTQSGGSRYESGRGVPLPVHILVALHVLGSVSDEDLARAKAVASVLATDSDE